MEAGSEHRSGVGIQFVGTSEADLRALKRFIDGFEEDERTSSD